MSDTVIESRLVANFGTSRTDDRDIVGRALILHFPEMEDNVLLAAHTFS